ncbi:MAG: carbohydrate-binding protein, partial [Methanosarcinales archaeon]
FRDISGTTSKFKDAVKESSQLTGDGDSLNDNWQIIYGRTDAAPYILGLAVDKKPSDNTYGSAFAYSSNEWNTHLMVEDGLSLSSGDDFPITYFLFAVPCRHISELWDEAQNGSLGGGASTEAGDGTTVVLLDASGEYVDVDLYAPWTGLYALTIRANGASASDTFSWQVDGGGSTNQDTTSGTSYDDYTVSTSLSLSQGWHTVRIQWVDGTIRVSSVALTPHHSSSRSGDFPGDIARQALRPVTIISTIEET